MDKNFMVDIIGGMTPDIVLRSKLSNENRIYIEVKEISHLRYNKEDSQIIRYFLHLIATSRQEKKGQDLQRAIILAAPKAWFDNNKNIQDWQYFLSKFGDLANSFNIKICKIIL